MDKKGFTVVELIVSFTLAMVISVFLFQIVINLKNLYTNSTIKTELINIQSLVSREMNENFKKGIISVDECGDRCFEFFYTDDTSDKLIISDDSIEFGNYKSKLPNNSYIKNESVNIASSAMLADSFDDSTLIVNIPIYNDNYKEEIYNIKIVYPYNSNKNDIEFGVDFKMDPAEFDYTGKEQVFTIPDTGYYQLEVWGAEGGSASTRNDQGYVSNYSGGYGGYSKGVIFLEKGKQIYINVGGKGIGSTTENVYLKGGYNGGGTVYAKSSVNHICASGGGATHMALTTGLLSTFSSKLKDLLIVAGGGGGARDQYNHWSESRWGYGGSGGGVSGVGPISSYGSTNSFTTVSSLGGGQASGYSFGVGQSQTGQSAGGGGLYGGYGGNVSGRYTGSGGGGSGYIGNELLINKEMYCYNCPTSSETTTLTYSTTNVSDKAISQYSKKGNGYARITYVGYSI